MCNNKILTIKDLQVNEDKTITKRLLWLDILKVVSVIFMIALHISAYQLSDYVLLSRNWQISNFINSCSRFCVPVFVMISGSIFLTRDCSMSKYIKRISIALIFWTITYTLYANTIPLLKGSLSIMQYINGLLYPTYLWFLFMILGLYLSTPILRMIVKSDTVALRFLILWLIFGIILPMLKHIPIISDYISSVLFQTHFTIALEYTGYFVLGFYLSKHKNIVSTKIAILAIILGVTSTFAGTWIIASKLGKLSQIFYDYLSPMSLLTSIGIFAICRNLFEDSHINQRASNLISKLASLSLGIYAIHMFFVIAFNKFGITTAIGNIVIAEPLICAITFIISSVVAWIMSKTQILSKLV